ncbi:MAG: fibrobacter succinogenes major paralogous domain-containing protein [Fibrobacter sp.]|nr:fibrobacter succinogenes major paralogous domain-containing protein [Fibrobacter sp.]
MKKEMIMGKILVTVVLLATFSMAGTMKDSRDGQTYKTVKIGDQVWMAENLNVNVSGSMCYDNAPANCEKYGRLYTWEAAMNACPSGWHLPSTEEFETLLSNVGSSGKERGENLRAASYRADKFGFSALPAGFYNSSFKEFNNLGRRAYFWSSTEGASGYYADDLAIIGYDAIVSYYGKDDGASVSSCGKGGGFSVRCLQDSN